MARGIGRWATTYQPPPTMASDTVAGGRLIAREIGKGFRVMTLTSRFLLYRGRLYPLAGLRVTFYENPLRNGRHWYVFTITSGDEHVAAWQETAPFALGAWRARRLRAFAEQVNQAARNLE